ncbi:MAG: hypothetical protein KBC64_05735 [Simkaniaceae bacterium]|nr:hypothetical protein [Simkaniaceae bacterium]
MNITNINPSFDDFLDQLPLDNDLLSEDSFFEDLDSTDAFRSTHTPPPLTGRELVVISPFATSITPPLAPAPRALGFISPLTPPPLPVLPISAHPSSTRSEESPPPLKKMRTIATPPPPIPEGELPYLGQTIDTWSQDAKDVFAYFIGRLEKSTPQLDKPTRTAIAKEMNLRFKMSPPMTILDVQLYHDTLRNLK